MEEYLTPEYLISIAKQLWEWIVQQVISLDILLGAILIGIAIPVGLLGARPIVKRLKAVLASVSWADRLQGKMLKAVIPLVKFIVVILLLELGVLTFAKFGLSSKLLQIFVSLMTAWVIIHFSTSLLNDSNWARLIAVVAWTAAALHILNLLGPTIAFLDKMAITMSGIRISLLLLIKGVIVFAVLIRLALNASTLLEKRLMALEDLTPSVQVLLTKALKVTLLGIAVVVALSSIGINLSALAFFGGAIGVGLGFGLQKVVSNLISGVILLLDKSIKPGDVIEVGSSYGRIQSLGARYVSVTTRDGFEYLIPNEDLITQQVINWSFSNKLVRLRIGVGVSYDADIHKAMDLMVKSAKSIPRVLNDPSPVCHLKNFGDSSVDLELRLWIADPEAGIANVSSAIRIAIWDALKENGIEIPFPQRDVHIKSQPVSA